MYEQDFFATGRWMKMSLIVQASQLKTPLKRLKEMFAASEHGRDLIGLVERARMWPLVTPLYSGLEQGMKVLAAHASGMTVIEATAPGKPLRRAKHNLAAIWNMVSIEAKELIEDHYAQFLSLHDYIPYKTAHEFLTHLAGPNGKGYEEWRYCLIEATPVRDTSVEAMMQIWESIIAAINKADDRNHSHGPINDLAIELHSIWDSSFIKSSIAYQDNSDTKENYDLREHKDEWYNWTQKSGGIINSAAALLWQRGRGETTEKNSFLSEIVRDTILSYQTEIIRQISSTSNFNMKYWAARASMNGIILREEAGKLRFTDPDTRLPERWCKEQPKDSVVLKLDDYAHGRVYWIRDFLYRNKFEVRENNVPFNPIETEQAEYLLTVMGVKEADGEVPIEVEIWTTPKTGPMRAAISVRGSEKNKMVQELRSIVQLLADDEDEEGEIL